MSESPKLDFVMINTKNNNSYIVKIVNNDKVDMDRYHWTKEYLEENYEKISDNAEFQGFRSSFIPQYSLKRVTA